jgi:hypothetical protein
VEAARRAVRLDPASFDAQLALARGLIRLGDPAALSAAGRAEALRPGDPAAHEATADALWLTGRANAAFAAFRQLSEELTGRDRDRALAKARALYRERAGWLGRLVASSPTAFGFALQRGWLHLR